VEDARKTQEKRIRVKGRELCGIASTPPNSSPRSLRKGLVWGEVQKKEEMEKLTAAAKRAARYEDEASTKKKPVRKDY